MPASSPYVVHRAGERGLGALRVLRQRRHVIRALFLKEIVTRFGGSRLGYVWVFLEPCLHAAFFIGLFYWRKVSIPGDIAVPVFVVTGMVPYFAFWHCITWLGGTIGANWTFFNYRQVRPIDCLLARYLLEVFLLFVVFAALVTLCHFVGWEVSDWPTARLPATLLGFTLFGLGVGAMAAVVAMYSKDAQKFFPFLLRPLYFLSGLFFMVAMLPVGVRPYFTWNPLLHGAEIVREELFGSVAPFHGSDAYFWAWACGTAGFGLILFHVHRHKAITTT